MTLVYLATAWTVGIILARQLDPSPHSLATLASVGLLGLLCSWRSKRGRLVAAVTMSALLGGWRYLVSQPVVDDRLLAHYNDGGRVTVQGWVSADPSIRATYAQLELSVEEVERSAVQHPVRGKLVMNVPHYPAHQYGDLLRVSGLLETPPVLDDFSYREYLACRGVHSVMRRVEVTVLPGRRGNHFLGRVFLFRQTLRKVIEAILPNPDAGLLSGILLGLGHTLPDYLAEAFRATGLTHIIVISGFNISLLLQAVMLGARRLLHRWIALWISLFAVVLYGLFVGPSSPVVRAALMGCLFVIGQLLGRRHHPPTSLAAATLVMTAWNPLVVQSVSFQLSFASTLGLIMVEPILARGLRAWLRDRAGDDQASRWTRVLRDILLATLVAQVATLPIVWCHFAQVSLVSLLANVLVLPVQQAIMVLGAIATGLGALWRPAGRMAAWAVWPFLRYTIIVVESLGKLRWAAIQVPRLSPGLAWALYAFFPLAFALRRDTRLRTRLREALGRTRAATISIVALALAAALIWTVVCSLPDQQLHLYVLDVGQGDAILLRTPGGRVILVDGGPDPLVLTSRLGQILPFWQRRIDLVVATHADQDHLAGLIPIVERYKVAHVMEPPSMRETPLSARWHEALAASGTRVVLASRGMKVRLGDNLRLEVLHPPADAANVTEDDANENSLVLRVTMGRFHVLLTADIGLQGEADLLKGDSPLQATILKVAHHGADSSTSAGFLSAVRPQTAVVSVGSDNHFGHPSERVLHALSALGCQVLRTDLHGTIECISDGQSYWTKLHRSRARVR